MTIPAFLHMTLCCRIFCAAGSVNHCFSPQRIKENLKNETAIGLIS